jgi:hypothetical protein
MTLETTIATVKTAGSLITLLKGCWQWATDRWRNGIPGLSVTARCQDEKAAGSTYKLKVYLTITNNTGAELELSHPYFRYRLFSGIRPDPLWVKSHLDVTRKEFRCEFRNPDPAKKVHDQPKIKLRDGESTSVWLGIDPTHSETDVGNIIARQKLGRLEIKVSQRCLGRDYFRIFIVSV